MAFDDFNIEDFNFEDMPWFDPSQFNLQWPDFGDFPVSDPLAGLDFDLGFDPGFDFGGFDLGPDPFALPTADFTLPELDLAGFGTDLGDLGGQGQFFLAPDQGPTPLDVFQPAVGMPGGTSLADLGFAPEDFGGGLEGLTLGPEVPSATNMGGLTLSGALGGEGAAPVLGQGFNLGANNTLNTGDALTRPTTANELLLARLFGGGQGRGTDWAGLGQLGLGLAGLGLKYFGPQPKEKGPTELDDELKRANIERIKAETERTLNPIFPPRGGGGGGGGILPPPPGGAPNVEAFKQAAGIPEMQARFDALYNQVLQETRDLPKPTPEAVQQQAQALIVAQMPMIRQDFEKQRQGVLERANRMGVNPAAELAQINQAEQQALQQLQVQAQTQALAFMQAQQAALAGRLTPAVQVLAQINPARAWSDLARVFGFPLAGQQTAEPFQFPESQPSGPGLSRALA